MGRMFDLAVLACCPGVAFLRSTLSMTNSHVLPEPNVVSNLYLTIRAASDAHSCNDGGGLVDRRLQRRLC